jgi:AcrR family transcriptional regulator
MREATRRRLLDAAYRVCAIRGIQGASVEAIAEEAGYTKGAVYSNFGGKEQLLLALFEERVQTFADQLVEIISGEGVDVPAASGEFVGAAARQHRAHFVLLCEFWSYAARDATIRRRFAASRRRYRKLLTEIVEGEARKFGVVLPVPAEHVAAGVLALSLGLVLEGLVDPSLDPGVAYQSMLQLVYRGALAD